MATDLEPYAGGDRTRLRQLHVLANAPSLIPDSFKSGSQVDWGAVALAAHAADQAGLEPVGNLKLFPVIKGQVFPMAEVWQVLARRHGWRVTVPVDTAERCVVHMVNTRTGETPPDFEMTLEEASQLGAAKTNPNYKDGAARSMVRSRAIRTAIKLNAPEVMQDPVTVNWGDEISGPAERGEALPRAASDTEGAVPAGPEDRMVPARSVAPDGSTIPEALREPEVDADVRAGLLGRLDALEELDADGFDRLREVCRALALPNVRSHRFTRAHGALLNRLITEVALDVGAAQADEQLPPEVHDDAIEASFHEAGEPVETLRYTPEEEELPF